MAAAQAPASSAALPFEAVLGRLYRADENEIAGIVAPLSLRQRAQLAVFCHGRVHLKSVELVIAATCDVASLKEAAPSNAAGQFLFERSRVRSAPAVRSPAALASTLARSRPPRRRTAARSPIADALPAHGEASERRSERSAFEGGLG